MSTPYYSPVGAGRIMFAKRGTLSAAEKVIMVGFKNESDLKINDDEPIKIDRGLELPNKRKALIAPESYQIGMTETQYIVEDYLRDSGADTFILMPSNKIFRFQDDTCLGIEAEFSIDEKTRKTKLTASNSLPYIDARNILDTAQSNGFAIPSYYTTNIANYFNRALYSAPNLDTIKWWGVDNVQSNMLTRPELISRKFAMKSSGDKNIFGQACGQWLEFTGEFVIRDASLGRLQTMLNKIFDHGFSFDERVGLDPGNYHIDRFKFNVGTMSFTPELTQGDKSATLTITFKGNVANTADNVVFSNESGGLVKILTLNA